MKKLFSLLFVIAICLSTFGQDVAYRSEKLSLDIVPPTQVIVWITPEMSETTLDAKQLEIKIGIQSNVAIEKVNIYLNGLAVSNNRGFRKGSVEDSKYDEVVEHAINLNPGNNTIRIEVIDESGNSFEDTRTFRVMDTALAAVMSRTDYALLIASDDYMQWSNLVNPVNDAREIQRELKESYNFEVEILENASKEDILLKIRDYAEKSYLPYDQLFIFFAGHGQFDEINGEGYIVCSDSKTNDRSYNSYLSHSTLRTRINSIQVQHIFLTMDACFGGTFDPTIAQGGSRGGEDMYQEISTVELIDRKLRYKTRKYLTSGGKEYVPDGAPGMNSPFASKFLAALRSDGGADHILTISDIKNYVELINPEPRLGSFGSDQAGSDFVFEKKH